jgi:hypothetical protein
LYGWGIVYVYLCVGYLFFFLFFLLVPQFF